MVKSIGERVHRTYRGWTKPRGFYNRGLAIHKRGREMPLAENEQARIEGKLGAKRQRQFEKLIDLLQYMNESLKHGGETFSKALEKVEDAKWDAEHEKKVDPLVRYSMERAFDAAGIHSPEQKQRLRKIFTIAEPAIMRGEGDSVSSLAAKTLMAFRP